MGTYVSESKNSGGPPMALFFLLAAVTTIAATSSLLLMDGRGIVSYSVDSMTRPSMLLCARTMR